MTVQVKNTTELLDILFSAEDRSDKLIEQNGEIEFKLIILAEQYNKVVNMADGFANAPPAAKLAFEKVLNKLRAALTSLRQIDALRQQEYIKPGQYRWEQRGGQMIQVRVAETVKPLVCAPKPALVPIAPPRKPRPIFTKPE